MIQSYQSIGLTNIEYNLYCLYSKNYAFHLIKRYQNLNKQRWKITNEIIFKDNRILLKLTEDKPIDNLNDKSKQNEFHKYPQNCLIKLTSNEQ